MGQFSASICWWAVAIRVIFSWALGAQEAQYRELALGASIRVFGSEAAMLQAWHAFFDQADPDALALFQVRAPHRPTSTCLKVQMNRC